MALDVHGVEQMLFSIHAMLAGISSTPELALDQTEAKTMAEAIGQVSRHYDVTIGAKALDWSNLIMVGGMIYGPRIVAVMQRRKGNSAPITSQAAPQPTRRNGANIVDIPGVGTVDVGSVN